MSPFMTAGTITRWKKKEGEGFAPGDVLLQIESDIAMIDVEAESAGILGKILMPDGSTNVPIEQVIALVVKSDGDLVNLPTPPPYNPTPPPPSQIIASPRTGTFNQPFFPHTHRSPTLVEMHGHYHRRGMTMQHHVRSPKLNLISPPPMTDTVPPIKPVLCANLATSAEAEQNLVIHDSPVDGAAIRRMFLLNHGKTSSVTLSSSPLRAAGKCDAKDYFDGII